MSRSLSSSVCNSEVFDSLFESASDIIYVLDLQGNFLAINRKGEELTGFKRENYIGKSFRKVIAAESLSSAVKGFQDVISGKMIRLILELKTAFGNTIQVEVTSTPFVRNGEVVGAFGIARDITHWKNSEKEKLRTLCSLIADPAVIVDGQGKILEATDRLIKILGFEKDNIVGTKFFKTEVLTDKDKTFLREKLTQRMNGEHIAPYEITVKAKDGKKLVFEVNAAKIEYEGKPVDFVVLHDVAQRKMLEERLSALNFYSGKLNTANNLPQLYELILDAMEKTLGFEYASFLIVDRGNLRVVSQRGYSEQIVLELPLDGSKKGVTVRAANSRKTVLVPDVTKNDEYVGGVPGIQSELAIPVDTGDRLLGVLNVESRKLAAFDEKDTALLQILASHAATAVGNIEKRGEIERRSSQLASLMKSSVEMIRSTDLRVRLKTIAEAINELGWRRVVISVRDENMDIENPEDMVTVGLTDEEREYLWNRRPPGHVWLERFGPEYERFKIGEFYHLPWSDPWVREKFSNGTVSSKLSAEDMVDWNPDDLLYAPLRLAEGRIVGVLSIDDPVDGKRPTKESLSPLELFIYQSAVAIENARLFQQLDSARKQIKEYADKLELKVEQRTRQLMETHDKLLKAERLAAIGEVAAMVGHDLRNPLTGIVGAAYYLKMKLSPHMDPVTNEMLELIEKDIEYSNKIVNDLLEYSKEMQLELTDTTPKSVMKEALSLVKIPDNINVLDKTSNEPRLMVDVEKMKRVFVNLIRNAIEAMPRGGKLTVTSKEANGTIRITFTDTGVGMTKEMVERMCTPLFTTKAKGMGLGLPICKRIIEAHGGNVGVESTVGKGTKFTLTIPIKRELEGGEKTWMKKPESLLLTTTKA